MSVLSLIIPCFNEERSLPSLIDALRNVKFNFSEEIHLEIIIIDDGSHDRTANVALTLAKANNDLATWQILELSRNFGKEAALLAGLDHCKGDACVFLDADSQDPPELIPNLVQKWLFEGAEVVNTVRRTRAGDGWLKVLSAFLFYRIFKKISRLDVRLDSSDYRLLDKMVIKAICSCREQVRFSKGFVAWAGFNQSSIEYDRPPRKSGNSEWSTWKLWNYALDGIFSFSTIPLRIWTYIGLSMAIISLAYAICITVKALLGGINVPGYASIVAIISFLGGIQLMGIGIIGEYIGRIFIESKKRPIYVIKNCLITEGSGNNEYG